MPARLDAGSHRTDDRSPMKTAEPIEFRRSGREEKNVVPWSQRWYGRVALLLASVAMLTLAYAPIGQCYLAWVGLVPWLVVIARCRSYKSAIFLGWASGTAFFIANMWWMAYVTFPGMLGLMAILAAYWAVMAAVVRFSVGSPDGSASPRPKALPIFIIAFAWTALEFIRGNFIWRGLPWLYLGHTQTPLLPICQIADTLGVYGVSFWVALINAIVAAWWLSGFRIAAVSRAVVIASLLTIGMLLYGVWRMRQTSLEPGPVVLVVQSNYPQSNTGEKGATEDEILSFHYETTRDALLAHPEIDLVVWSETVMPALNQQTRLALSGYEYGTKLKAIVQLLMKTSGTFSVGLITGGHYDGLWDFKGEFPKPTDSRNSSYFFERSGLMSDLRYDKIHIVPFGEFMPFRDTWVYGVIKKFGPPDMDAYQLNGGDEDNLTVFPLRKTRDVMDLSTWRLVTPICFEDIDSGLTARMFRPGPDGLKRADVLVNLTNDGWFKANEMSQHLQVAAFRSIENRVPTARSVNTGISGFVDSVGRTHDLIAAGTAGFSIAKLGIDPRVTFYTRYGDLFAWICVSVAGSAVLLKMLGAAKSRMTQQHTDPQERP
ncbi:apolipoprotein N-acyltransferase [soil metagenome]